MAGDDDEACEIIDAADAVNKSAQHAQEVAKLSVSMVDHPHPTLALQRALNMMRQAARNASDAWNAAAEMVDTLAEEVQGALERAHVEEAEGDSSSSSSPSSSEEQEEKVKEEEAHSEEAPGDADEDEAVGGPLPPSPPAENAPPINAHWVIALPPPPVLPHGRWCHGWCHACDMYYDMGDGVTDGVTHATCTTTPHHVRAQPFHYYNKKHREHPY